MNMADISFRATDLPEIISDGSILNHFVDANQTIINPNNDVSFVDGFNLNTYFETKVDVPFHLFSNLERQTKLSSPEKQMPICSKAPNVTIIFKMDETNVVKKNSDLFGEVHLRNIVVFVTKLSRGLEFANVFFEQEVRSKVLEKLQSMGSMIEFLVLLEIDEKAVIVGDFPGRCNFFMAALAYLKKIDVPLVFSHVNELNIPDFKFKPSFNFNKVTKNEALNLFCTEDTSNLLYTINFRQFSEVQESRRSTKTNGSNTTIEQPKLYSYEELTRLCFQRLNNKKIIGFSRFRERIDFLFGNFVQSSLANEFWKFLTSQQMIADELLKKPKEEKKRTKFELVETLGGKKGFYKSCKKFRLKSLDEFNYPIFDRKLKKFADVCIPETKKSQVVKLLVEMRPLVEKYIRLPDEEHSFIIDNNYARFVEEVSRMSFCCPECRNFDSVLSLINLPKITKEFVENNFLFLHLTPEFSTLLEKAKEKYLQANQIVLALKKQFLEKFFESMKYFVILKEEVPVEQLELNFYETIIEKVKDESFFKVIKCPFAIHQKFYFQKEKKLVVKSVKFTSSQTFEVEVAISETLSEIFCYEKPIRSSSDAADFDKNEQCVRALDKFGMFLYKDENNAKMRVFNNQSQLGETREAIQITTPDQVQNLEALSVTQLSNFPGQKPIESRDSSSFFSEDFKGSVTYQANQIDASFLDVRVNRQDHNSLRNMFKKASKSVVKIWESGKKKTTLEIIKNGCISTKYFFSDYGKFWIFVFKNRIVCSEPEEFRANVLDGKEQDEDVRRTKTFWTCFEQTFGNRRDVNATPQKITFLLDNLESQKITIQINCQRLKISNMQIDFLKGPEKIRDVFTQINDLAKNHEAALDSIPVIWDRISVMESFDPENNQT